MGKLSEQIQNDCCGALLGAAEKQMLVAELAELERLYEAKLLESLALEDEIVALVDLVEAKARRVFFKVYRGTQPIELAWSLLRKELQLGPYTDE